MSLQRASPTPAQRVGIFRQELFRPSETFITSQAESLRMFTPLYLGARAVGNPPRGATAITLNGRPDNRQSWGSELSYTVLRQTTKLAAKARPLAPVLIHAHFALDGLYALDLARRLDAPLVTTVHGHDISSRRSVWLRQRNPLALNYGIFYKRLSRRGNLFLAVSQHIARLLVHRGYPAEQIVVHYTGVDTNVFRPGDWPREPFVVAHVARLVEKKGTAELLIAFGRVLKLLPAARLEIVGDGPLSGDLKKLTVDLGLGSAVIFHGARDHEFVLRLLQRASVVCQPSKTARSGDQEGLPTVILEAAACATPVIATRHSGIPEAVDDGVTGLLVNETDSAGLAKALRVALEDEQFLQSAGAAARQRVVTRFDLCRQTDRLERIYRDLL